MSRPAKTILLALSVLLALAAQADAGAGREQHRDSTSVELADDRGYLVVVPRQPRRIISLTMFTDDILVELVDHRRILGLTNFSLDPSISNVAGKTADIPNRLTLNTEVIIALQPDLVFVANWSEADKVQQLRKAVVPVFLIATGLTIPAIEQKIRIIGRLVGEQEAAERMIERMGGRLQSIKLKVSKIPLQKRLTVLDYSPWGSAQGKGSSWDEIVRLAGLINAVAEFSADEWAQVFLSAEKLLELDPDILILPGWVAGDPQGADSFYRELVNDPSLRGMRAIREKRVYRMPEGLKTATSQYIADAVETLARFAFPDLFK